MILSRKLLLVSCLCFVFFVNAQEELLSKIDSVKKIEDINIRTVTFAKILQAQDTISYTKETGVLYHELGMCHYRAEVYGKALLFFDKAISVHKAFSEKENLVLSRFWSSKAYLKSEKPQEEYEMLYSIIDADGSDQFTGFAYMLLSHRESSKGDFSKALHYLNLGIANKKLCENFDFESNFRLGIIGVYAKKYENTFNENDTNSDLEIIQNNEELIKVEVLNLGDKSVLYNNLAVLYDSFGDLVKSLNYYKKALEYYVEIGNKNKELDVVNNIGIVYSKQKKYVLANKYYKKIINESDDEEQIASALDNIGYYLPNTSAKEKLPYFQKAVQTILEKETNQKFHLPTFAEIKKSGYEQEILIYLIDLAAHYVQAFKQENDTSYLLKGKETVLLIDHLVSLIRYETETEASKLFWIEKGVNTYMLAVEICYLLDDTANAFYFMEKNKALLLQENIKTLEAKLALDIPRERLEREYKLYYDVLTLEEQFQQSIDNDVLKEAYSLKNKEFKTFMDSMKREFPEYTKTKQNISITSLTTVITEFQAKKTAFVEYILHETDGYGIYYDSEKPIFFKITDIPKFQENLEVLKKYMTKRTMNPSELKAYQEIGYEVFQQLFPFKNAAERLKDKKITIIPDQSLQYIPFEILPTQPNGKLSEVYFVNSTETSYLQSFSLFEQIEQKKNSPTQKLLAIAPYEFKDSALSTLTGTEKVLEFLSKYESVTLLTKKEASKANFLKYRNDFEIIHLNTHAGLDSIAQTPWIAFNEEKMSLNELFGLENQADLVILDACKTNDGVHLSGEGLINLSRGFFYNGTQSVLASQWNVNEQAGNKIIQEFYTEIEKGTSKSKALQLAKKAYLQNHDGVQNNPYYWAAFTLTGSTNTVLLQPVQNYIYIFIGIAILVFGALFFYYRKKISA